MRAVLQVFAALLIVPPGMLLGLLVGAAVGPTITFGAILPTNSGLEILAALLSMMCGTGLGAWLGLKCLQAMFERPTKPESPTTGR